MKLLSVVLPAYNEEKMIEKAGIVIGQILEEQKIPYEIVFVDDGSKDGTWSEIERTAQKDPHIAGVHFFQELWKRICNVGRTGKYKRRLLRSDGL